jgi:hypothetical protein
MSLRVGWQRSQSREVVKRCATLALPSRATEGQEARKGQLPIAMLTSSSEPLNQSPLLVPDE